LESSNDFKNQKMSVGYANWIDFHENDEVSHLFFILIDFVNKKAHFHHKNTMMYEEKYFLRNANEVSKTLRIIHQILKEESWAKYLEYKDIDVIRFEICTSLQCSNDSFLKIKNKYIQK
jgi:dynactin complex subunit